MAQYILIYYYILILCHMQYKNIVISTHVIIKEMKKWNHSEINNIIIIQSIENNVGWNVEKLIHAMQLYCYIVGKIFIYIYIWIRETKQTLS